MLLKCRARLCRRRRTTSELLLQKNIRGWGPQFDLSLLLWAELSACLVLPPRLASVCLSPRSHPQLTLPVVLNKKKPPQGNTWGLWMPVCAVIAHQRHRTGSRIGHRTGQAQQPPPRSPKESIWKNGEAAPQSYRHRSNALKHEVWAFVFHFTALQSNTAGLNLLKSPMGLLSYHCYSFSCIFSHNKVISLDWLLMTGNRMKEGQLQSRWWRRKRTKVKRWRSHLNLR